MNTTKQALHRIEVSNLGQGDLFRKADDVLARADANRSDTDEDAAEIGCGECGWKGMKSESRTVAPLGYPIAHHECPKCGKPCTVSYITLDPLEDSAEREAFDKFLDETSGFDEHDEAIAWAAWKERAALSAPERKVLTDEQIINTAYDHLQSAGGGIYQSHDRFHWYGDDKELIAFVRALAALNQQGEQTAPGCGCCGGTGRMVRDPDIGTDQECFACDGTGKDAEAQQSDAPSTAQKDGGSNG